MNTAELLYREAWRLLEELAPYEGGTGHVAVGAENLLDTAVRYARIRADWERATPAARQEMNETRTQAHDAFIGACNVLARAMAQVEMSVTWREQLGNDRKTLGDFACFLHCALGVRAR
mgnify:CR=1 FL=1